MDNRAITYRLRLHVGSDSVTLSAGQAKELTRLMAEDFRAETRARARVLALRELLRNHNIVDAEPLSPTEQKTL